MELHDIYIYTFNDQRRLEKLKHANHATFNNGKWMLKQVNESTIQSDSVNTINRLNEEWKTNLTPDKLGVASLRPTSLSISGLSSYITFLKETGQDSKTSS